MARQADNELVSYRLQATTLRTHKENFMNKLLTAIFTSVLLAVSAAALAGESHGDQGKKGPRNQHSTQGMPVIENLMRAIRHLDLSDEQRESVRTVMQDLKTEVRPIMAETKTNHTQLKELIKADKFDEDAVAELAAKEGELAAERTVLASRAMSDVFSFLTDEQRAELDEMAAKRMGHRGKRRQQRTGDS